ncbi:hypothetical protein EUX98_g8669 [Antrodiella citrinella]|uniref:Uncharacterized protein n=1 Tax=Antrodiella citrinella TaxID=2447956 RepID=A0A4V3XG46_9APHY|nr:hypothetical protein EUX98_g8669 [Antrodiella citrinella]
MTDNNDAANPSPFANMSIWRLMNWMWSGSDKKSMAETDRLVHEVLMAPDFNVLDLKGFSAARETLKLDEHIQTSTEDGWVESNMVIEVPDGKRHASSSDADIPTFSIPGLVHRPLVEVIKSAWTSTSSSRFHYLPFRQFWKRSDSVVERIHGELYSSDSFIAAHEELQQAKLDRNPTGCNLEKSTTAREAVYKYGKGVKSTVVESLLAEESLVPTTNAFSDFAQKVLPVTFNFFVMLVVDLMHEFELGVWKAVFTHLIRIIVSLGDSVVQEFNLRYRQMPTFGRSTIRRKTSNTSALKKLAARDYEDYLQCALPVFENLIPNPVHNKTVMDLLFTLADWHACAKLRMHTDSTLALLKSATTSLGSQLRAFIKKTCPHFDTKELAREEAAGIRRKARARAQGKTVKASGGAKPKTLNLLTYKLHALGDYLVSIIFFGTTDSYSTQPGELEHRRVKRYYARTNKIKAARQIARQQRREEEMRKRKERVYKALGKKKARPKAAASLPTNAEQPEPLNFTPPEDHHQISHSRHFGCMFPQWLEDFRYDPAMKDFMPRLLNHLLGRLMNPDDADSYRQFSNSEQQQIILRYNQVFRHKIVRVNYTTYDVRRGQDSLNPSSHADIMIPAFDLDPETGVSASGHPFAYARILGVFHAHVMRRVPGQREKQEVMEFLLVRWFRLDTRYKAGFNAKRLYRLEFVPELDDDAFGFLNPDDIIRASHIIPAFAYGRVQDPTLYYDIWRYYYVNIFVDRDMYMRYRGGGVGHTPLHITHDQANEDTPGTEANDMGDTASTLEVLEEEEEDGSDDEVGREPTDDSDNSEPEDGGNDEVDDFDADEAAPEEGRSAEDAEGYDEL